MRIACLAGAVAHVQCFVHRMQAERELGTVTRVPPPVGWTQKWSERRCRVYYVNKLTKQRCWRLPKEAVEKTRAGDGAAASSSLPEPACLVAEEARSAVSEDEGSDSSERDDREIHLAQVHAPVTLGDAARLVAQHYDEVCEAQKRKQEQKQQKQQRQSERAERCEDGATMPDTCLERSRCLNNWVKETVMHAAMDALCRVHPLRNAPVAVFDMAGGRGGDIGKFVRCLRSCNAQLKAYASADISTSCVREACSRAQRLLSSETPRCHVVCDVGSECPHNKLQRSVPPHLSSAFGQGGFRLVWCAFALHYFFASEVHLRMALAAAAKSLCLGGLFVATYMDANVVLKLAREAASEKVDGGGIPADAMRPIHELAREGKQDPCFEFESQHWRIQMPWRTLIAVNTKSRPYTLRYRFWMPARCVDAADYFVNGDLAEEYMAVDDVLMDVAADYGLRPIFECKNMSIIRHAAATDAGRQRMESIFQRIGPRSDALGDGLPKHSVHRFVTQADLEVAALYKTVAFAATVDAKDNVTLREIQQVDNNRVKMCANSHSSPVDALGVAIAYNLQQPQAMPLPYAITGREAVLRSDGAVRAPTHIDPSADRYHLEARDQRQSDTAGRAAKRSRVDASRASAHGSSVSRSSALRFINDM